METVYVVFRMHQFAGVSLYAFKLKSDAEKCLAGFKKANPAESGRIETLEVK
jgi:hypothetical protein